MQAVRVCVCACVCVCVCVCHTLNVRVIHRSQLHTILEQESTGLKLAHLLRPRGLCRACTEGTDTSQGCK